MFQFSLSAVPLLSIAAAIFIVYLPMGTILQGRMESGFEASAPRAGFDQLPDRAKRATWAHQNGFETLPSFIAAALMAYVTGPHDSAILFGLSGDVLIAILCTVFLVFRVVYTAAYINGTAPLRSLSFGIGGLCLLGLFGLAIGSVLWVNGANLV